MKTPAILQLSDGKLEDNDIRRILDCKLVSIEKYRVLADILDVLEQT